MTERPSAIAGCFVPLDLALAIEGVEREAQADQRFAAPPRIREAVGLDACWIGDVLALTARRAGPPRWNRVDGLGVRSPASEALLDTLRDHFAWNEGRFETNLAPFARPRVLREMLRARGFAKAAEEVKWVRDARPAPPARTDLRIARASAAHASGIDETLGEAFGEGAAVTGWMAALIEREGWHVYVALDGPTVVATGSFFVRDGAAWLGIAGTRASHRGRGAQSALVSARIEGARAAGALWLTLETDDDTPEKPNPSHHNAARAGFAVAYRREIWVSRPQADAVSPGETRD